MDSCILTYTNVDVLRILNAAGADLNVRGNQNITPLMIYSINSAPEAIKFYMEQFKDPKERREILLETGPNGVTAFTYAVIYEEYKVVEYFIELFSTFENPIEFINAKSSRGYTSLMMGVIKRNVESVKLILNSLLFFEDGASVLNTKDSDGHTVLMYADHEEIAEAILGTAESLSILHRVLSTTHNGMNPLMIACYNGRIDTVKAILKYIKKLYNPLSLIDAVDDDGNTAFYYTLIQYYTNIAALLIEAGVDINRKDGRGMTYLMIGIELNNEYIVRYLIDIGARIDLRNNDGHTALDLAKKQIDDRFVRILEEADA